MTDEQDVSVVDLFPNQSVPAGLRDIAAGVENGDYPGGGCTVIIGTNVFHLGCVDDGQAASDALFNMTLGIHKLMSPILEQNT